MVLISVYGLDPYCIGNYSKEHTEEIANLLECSKDEIHFVALEHYLFHDGVDQTSWNLLVNVKLDSKYRNLAKNLATYLLETVKLFGVHVTVKFEFTHDDDYLFSSLNEDYPRYLTDKNMVKVEEEVDEDVDITDEEQVYTGNIFKDFSDK